MIRRFYHLALVMGIVSTCATRPADGQSCVPDLTADANGDCVVDPLDSGFVLARLGCPVGSGDPGCDSSDANGDGEVDPLDLGYVLARFCGGGILPTVAVTPPVPLTNQLTVGIEGTSVGATQVEVAGGTELVTVNVDQCMFDVEVGLVENQVNFLYVTGISGEGVRGTPYPVTVTNDTKHPDLFIDFPANGAELTTETTDVAGRVSDTLSGFVGLSVNVNGIPASVDEGIGTNGTFFLGGLSLVVGDNLITAMAADVLGNMISTSITVKRIEIPIDVPTMTVLFGNGQTASVHTWLPVPIMVQVNKGDGTPFANKVVTFDVTRSDGRLAADPSGEGSLMFQTHTDADGKAMAYWRLGGTAGAGSDRISATSTSIVGSAFFCATATAGPAHHINIGSGNNQRAEVESLAPAPLRIWVNDQCNGVADLPVTFTVVAGSGTVNGASSVTIVTEQTGHAEVTYFLGPEPGNQRVEATYDGNEFSPATFVIYGVERVEGGVTTFSGLIIDNASRPLGGAGVTLLITGQDAGSAVSDDTGQFTILGITLSGEANVFIDGDTITTVNGQTVPAGTRFPDLHYNTQIIEGAANALSTPVRLPPLSTVNDRVYYGDQTTDLELICEGIDGLKMIVRAGTTITLPDGAHVGPAYPGSSVTLAVNQVHHDDVPMPMTDGAAPPFAWTLQPAGSKFDPPVQVEYPNMTGLPAGSISNFLSFNHTTNKFEIIATGTVSADGSLITSDPGDGIDLSGWGCNCPPYSVAGDCEKCLVVISGPRSLEVGETIVLTADQTPVSWSVAQSEELVLYSIDDDSIEITGVGTSSSSDDVIVTATYSDEETFCQSQHTLTVGAVLEIVDPNVPCLRGGDHLSDDPDLLSSEGTSATGLVADGITPLLLRVMAPGPGTVAFTVSDELDDTSYESVGVLFEALDFDNDVNPIFVSSVEVDDQWWAFAILKSPCDFVREDNVVNDEALGQSSPRQLFVEAMFEPDDSETQEYSLCATLSLHRPPVLLLHGLWSNSATWTWPLLKDPRFLVKAWDYEHSNALSFAKNNDQARQGIQAALWLMRKQQIAVTQADVIGHSLGGVLSRLYVSSGDYLRSDNFELGDVHKLITANSPHRGSPSTCKLVTLDNISTDFGIYWAAITGNCVTCGAIRDLRPDSDALSELDAAVVPAHAMVGTGGSDLLSDDLLTLTGVIGKLFDLVELFTDVAKFINGTYDGDEHDVIVPLPSQEGELAGAHVSPFGSFEGIHTFVPKKKVIGERAIVLLNARLGDGLFNPEFPATSGISYTACEPVPPGPGIGKRGGEIQIVSPPAGSAVSPGEAIDFVVEGVGGFEPTGVVIALVEGDSALVEIMPFQATLTIPVEAIGQVEAVAVGVDQAGVWAISESVFLDVEQSAALVSITIEPDSLLLVNFASTLGVRAYGDFDDGVRRDMSSPSLGTMYSTMDPSVASVDAEGLVTGLRVGSTMLEATNGLLQATAEIVVLSTPFDKDVDGDVDRDDFLLFQACLSGPNDDPEYVMPDVECRDFFDHDEDSDVDLDDFDEFLRLYTGQQDDCDENGSIDLLDILTGALGDMDLDGIADPCDGLDTSLTVTVNGQPGQAESDGSFRISNISAGDAFGEGGPGTAPDFLSDEFQRVVGTSTVDGIAYWHLSQPFQLRQSETVVVPELTITATPPVLPESLSIVTPAGTTLEPGETTTLTVIAKLGDGSETDVTPSSSWTTYRSSNLQVAGTNSEGVLTAAANGVAFITVTNGGATAVARVDVVSETVVTTVEGVVLIEDGSAAGGAQVTVNPWGAVGSSDEEGHFAFQATVPLGASLSVSATLVIDGRTYDGASPSLPAIAPGITDCGIIVIKPRQVFLFGNPEFTVGSEPRSVIFADFDGDSHIDLAAANFVGDNISVLLNNGDGTFADHSLYGTGDGPRPLASGDLNGDGAIDLAVTNLNSDNVSVLLNGGDGVFAADVLYGTGDGPHSVVVRDLDGDGDADLGVANGYSDSISVLLNNGDGTFAEDVLYSAGDWPYSVAAGDLDGDGGADLAVANYNSDNVSVLLNNGDGTFADDVLLPVSNGPSSVALTDLDTDGDADLAVVNNVNGMISVLLNNGDGTFADDELYTAGSGSLSLATGDVDADGDQDLVVVNPGGSNDDISILLNYGDGTFAGAVVYRAGDEAFALGLGDSDGDGDNDVAVANRLGNSVSVLLNLGDGTFADDELYGTGAVPYSVAVGDLDGDGDNDLAAGNYNGDDVSVLLNNGDGTFADDVLIGRGNGPRSVAIGDLDKDGDADLATANTVGHNVSVLLNNGDGTFADDVLYGAGESPYSVVSGDLNGDGYADLVTANYNDDTVSVFLNDGDGTFSDSVAYATGVDPYSVTIVDLDGDDDNDLGVANSNGDSISILMNSGDGTFAAHVPYSAGNGPRSIVGGDLDGDGDADLAVANYLDDKVSVFFNNGDGTFVRDVLYVVGDFPQSLALSDLDGDGDSDLITANFNVENVSVLLNNGDGTFIHTLYGAGNSPWAVAVSDLDGDGDGDLVVANDQHNNVSILLNRRIE